MSPSTALCHRPMVSLVENPTDRPQKRPTLWRVLTENSGTLVSNFAMFLPLRKTHFHIYIYNHISFQPSSYFIIAPPFFIEILGPTVVFFNRWLAPPVQRSATPRVVPGVAHGRSQRKRKTSGFPNPIQTHRDPLKSENIFVGFLRGGCSREEVTGEP